MPSQETRKIASRLLESTVKMATSFPDMKWRDIYTELQKQRQGDEYLGKPGTTQKAVANARKKISDLPNPEDNPWKVDMVGDPHPVSPEALADVLSAWRWHKVGQGIPFTVRMAKWVSRLRLLVGTKELEKNLAKYMDVPANCGLEDDIRDGLLTMQSLRLAREAVAIASEELACIALKRDFDPITLMSDLAWSWLDQPADPMAFQLHNKAKQKTLDQLDRASGFEISEYQTATTAKAYGSDMEDWSTSISLDPLDKIASEVLNTVSIVNGTNPPGKTHAERNEFVRQQLLNVTTGRVLLND
jgi:hypothetical protein